MVREESGRRGVLGLAPFPVFIFDRRRLQNIPAQILIFYDVGQLLVHIRRIYLH
jgi:hypothetical protein